MQTFQCAGHRGCLVLRAELVREGFLEETAFQAVKSQSRIQSGACTIGPQVATPRGAHKLPGLATCVSPQLRAHVGANSSLLPLRLRADDDAHVALATASVPTGFQELKCDPDTSKVSLRLS